ncbi:MAG: Fic family protein [Firmicutes bacterium]|nr:hypothetical protein [Clostridiales bacterium]MBQ4339384.1 Fic family protein [Bacillota bacterium]
MKLANLRSDLNERLKKKPELKRKITAISKLQWIESSYDFDTAYTRNVEALDTEDIQQIIKGEYLVSRTVTDHIMVRNYYDMVKYVYGVLSLKSMTDLPLIERINRILTRDEMLREKEDVYRRSVPIVKEFAMVPPHHQLVKEELMKVIKDYNIMHGQLDPVLRGCFIHNEFLRVYPFSASNEATAKALLNFELLSGGYLPLAFGMEKEEFRACVSRHINNGDPKPFFELILKEEKKRYLQFLEME